MNDFMELRRVIAIALRRWWLLVVLAAIGVGIGYVISRGQTPAYQATTTVLVGESIRSARVDRVDIQISEALIQTYVEIARRQPVMQGVVTTLNLNESWQDLKKRVTVTPIESTQLIEITVEASSPELAQIIADEIVNQLILLSPSSSESVDSQLTNSFNREQITKLQERIVEGQQRLAEIENAINNSVSEIELAALQQEKANLEGLLIEWERNYTQLLTLTEPKRDPTQLTVVEPAHSNNRMIRPRTQLNMILGGILGLVVALALVFLLDFLDDTYRSLKDFSQSEEVSILGSIRRIKGKRLSDKVIAHFQPHSPVSESYRIIRSRIRFKRVDQPARSIMVTSSMPEEGKSLTVANLAVVFAQANIKTVIVDADLRHPVLHEVFDVENSAGLGDVLSSSARKVEDYIKVTSVDNLRILTSGKALPDPSGLLGSERMEEIITELKATAEMILFDSPPVLVFADAIALSRRMDGIIVVIQAGKSQRSAINQTLLDLQNANANVLGSIFNQAPKSDSFSVNKLYMQERPTLPFTRALVRKEDRFRGLRDSALPLNENPQLSEAHDERGGVVEPESHEPGTLVGPVFEHPQAPISDSGNGKTNIGVLHDVKIVKDTNHHKPSPKLHDLASPTMVTDENTAMSSLASESAGIDEIQIPDREGTVAATSGIGPETSGLDGEQAAGAEELVGDLAGLVLPALETGETPDLDSERVGDVNIWIEERDPTTEPVGESLEMPGLEGTEASMDDVQFPEGDSAGIPANVNIELPRSDGQTDAGEGSDHQKKKRRRKKSKQQELKSEGVVIGSPADPPGSADE